MTFQKEGLNKKGVKVWKFFSDEGCSLEFDGGHGSLISRVFKLGS
jgi:hypothetical protein